MITRDEKKRLAGCVGKHRHANYTAASVEARRADPKGKHGIHAYRCKFCGGWHVGHNKRRIEDRRTRILREIDE